MTLDDRINGRTMLLAVLGNPIEHSVSPQLHNTLSAMLGINAVYIPVKVEKDAFGDMVRGLKAGNFTGFNVTIPFKEEITKYADHISDEVKLIGSANTVVNKGGVLYAYNTDAEGFLRAFEEETGSGFKNKHVVILGAGGTTRSLAAKIASEEAAGLKIINRTLKKAEDIAGMVKSKYSLCCEAADFSDSLQVESSIKAADIIINTTSVGMHPHMDKSPLDESISFSKNQIVYDVIYNPPKTKLLKKAESCGCKTANGLGMLFYQGILAYEKWMNIKIPQEIVKKLYEQFSKYLIK